MDPTKRIGRYEILAELGQGAMGTVYRAKDPAMDRVVALKTIISVALASEQGAEFRERFYHEARAAGALSHPGIVAVFDVGEHEGMPFLVMEFVDGRTLAEAVEKGERLSLDRVCEIGQKIAEALGYAHQRGVIHRDIKPANILLTTREAHGIERPKITDFGVAKLAEGQATLTGQIRGTPAFMSPEQFTGAPVDGRADIFSLGVVLYWLATGEQPFPGKSMSAVFYKIVHTEPVPPRKLNPSLPTKLEGVILKCLAKDPADRYRSGEELSRELGNIRTTNSATGAASAAQAVPKGGDPDATIFESPPVTDVRSAAFPPLQTAVAAPEKKPANRWLWAAALAVLIAAGGWYLLPNRGKSKTQEKALAAASVPTVTVADADAPPAKAAAAPVVPSPTAAAPIAATPKVAATAAPVDKPAKKPATKALARSEGTPAAKTAATEPPALAAVGFDPKSLDPKQNAKLKIDRGQMPPGIGFIIEMNGQIYLEQKASATDTGEPDVFVPPGVQEFRVVANAGAVRKISNIVSAEFKAKKKNTLKIELRTQGMAAGSGVPQGLYPDTQIVLTLK